MTSSAKEHVHKFDILTTQDVLLASYHPEEGKMTYQNTTGKDKIKLRKCKCGASEAYDLERTYA